MGAERQPGDPLGARFDLIKFCDEARDLLSAPAMCLIIRKPCGRRIPAAFIENAWRQNGDGWGGCLVGRGAPQPSKGLAFDDLLAFNAALPVRGEALLHLRKATYGPVCHDMAHPFEVVPGLLLMHNGSIDALAPSDPTQSDTAMLAALLRDMLDGLTAAQACALVRSTGFARLVSPLLHGSMVLLIDSDGLVRLGREWHVVQPDQWDAAMSGIEVSNNRTWTPRSAAAERTEALSPHGTATAKVIAFSR